MTNSYCQTLGIEAPSLDTVKAHPEANTFTLLIVALLEHGGPMRLDEVAVRLESAGMGAAELVLRSLKRCRPARDPVYRDEDHYALDPHSEELDLWAFRLGLRPPKAPRLRLVKPEPEPLPAPEIPLTAAELEEALRDAHLSSWSAQRLALAVLDSQGGRMEAAQVVETLDRLVCAHPLRVGSAQYWRRGSPIREAEDGTWVLELDHPALHSAREAVRQRIETQRRQQANRPDPVMLAVQRRRYEVRRSVHAAELARLRRVLVHSFPKKDPEAVILVDVDARELTSYLRQDFDVARARLVEYDLIGAENVRLLLRGLQFEPSARLAELGPPQKTRKLNRAGRTLKITSTMLVQGSCGILRPFGEPAKLLQYIKNGQTTQLQHRLEADAKSLFALYQYGRLHGSLRLRWGFLDETLSVPWAYHDETRLYHLMQQAHENGEELEVVLGNAPAWAEPWAHSRHCHVRRPPGHYGWLLVDEAGFVVDEREVQLARQTN